VEAAECDDVVDGDSSLSDLNIFLSLSMIAIAFLFTVARESELKVHWLMKRSW